MKNFAKVVASKVPAERLIQFEHYLHTAAQQDVLPETLSPEALPSGNDAVAHQLRGVVVRRLMRLGYLKTDKNVTDAALFQAIKSLQEEAGLLGDGWMGSVTWQAMQELFSFEEPTNLLKWLKPGGENRFLQRAVNLRLKVLGIASGAGGRASTRSYAKPLAQWSKLLVQLKVPGTSVIDPSQAALLWLFNLDGLTQHIRSHPAHIRALTRQFHPKSSDHKCVMRFLASLLKVELWLNGYNQITPADNVLTLSRGTSGKLNQAMRNLWRDVEAGKGISIGKFAKLSGTDRLLLSFEHIADWNDEDNPAGSSRQRIVDEIFEELGDVKNQQSNVTVATVSEQWTRIGWFSWVMDGLKRIWNAFKKFIRRLTKAAVYLTRGIKQIVSQGYFYVARTFYVFSRGVGYIFDRDVKASSHKIAARRNLGFDYDVFIDKDIKDDQVSRFFAHWYRQHLHFRASIRILELVIHVIQFVAGLAQGPLWWWRIVPALLSVYRSIDEEDLAILIKAYQPA